MPRRLQVLIVPALDAQLKEAVDRPGYSTPDDPVERLASLNPPMGDIDQMLTEIESGRI